MMILNMNELLKQKDAYPYEYMDSFIRFIEENMPDEKCFNRSVKDEKTDDNGEQLDGHISNKDCLKWKTIGMNLTWKIWVIITTIT